MADESLGMRKVLNWVKSNYGDVPIYVQTAMSGKYRDLNEIDAETFIRAYLNEVLKGRYILNGNYIVTCSLFGVACITFAQIGEVLKKKVSMTRVF